jgi:protein-disulfide isomerase
MSSRAQTKAALRQQRLAIEATERRQAARRRTLWRLAAIAAAALALTAGAIVLSRPAEDPPVASAATPVTRFDGIAQDGITLGSAQAPATMVEFADLQCPYCGVYGRDVLPTVVERFVRTGRLKLQLNVLTFLGEDSVRAGKMAAAAALQDRFWDFTDAFNASQGEENSGYVTDAFLDRVGAAARLDMPAARAAQDGSPAQQLLSDAQDAADELGVQSTPSFFVRKGDGRLTPLEFSDLTPEAFATALEQALAR